MTFLVYEELFFTKSRAMLLCFFVFLIENIPVSSYASTDLLLSFAFHINKLSLFPLPHPWSLVKQIALLSKSCSSHWQQWWQVNPPLQACWRKEHKKYICYRDVFASAALSLYTAKLKSVHGMKKDLVALVGDSFTGV